MIGPPHRAVQGSGASAHLQPRVGEASACEVHGRGWKTGGAGHRIRGAHPQQRCAGPHRATVSAPSTGTPAAQKGGVMSELR